MTDSHQPSQGVCMASFRNLCNAIGLAFSVCSSAFAIAGIGVHWGNDFTLSMEDAEKEWVTFDNLEIDTAGLSLGSLPSGITGITGEYLPVYISRLNWTRTNFNIGGKAFIDIIPFIDAAEVSFNFGVWEYKGSISYPTAISPHSTPSDFNPDSLFDVTYATRPLTLKEFGMDYFGLDETPYAKLTLDFTIRKYLFKFPPVVNILKIYGGGGLSVHYATPVLSQALIQDAIGDQFKMFSLESLQGNLFNMGGDPGDDIMKAVVDKIIEKSRKPIMGCHLDVGAMVKLPVIPVGFYVDGKFMIPFSDLDEHVDIGGLGVLLNTGISLTL